MTTAERPSREQWAERQSQLPKKAREALAAIAADRETKRQEEEVRAERERAEADQWRSAYEAAVAAALVAVGAEWLVPFRVPDHECGAREFTGNTQDFIAVFDPTAVGCWPICLRMVSGTGRGRECATAHSGWKVARPSGMASFTSFNTALEIATAYTTPF